MAHNQSLAEDVQIGNAMSKDGQVLSQQDRT